VSTIFSDSLVDKLLEWNIITEEQRVDAINEQQSNGELLCNILVEKEYATWKQILGCYARMNGACPLSLENLQIDASVLELVPEKVANYYKAIPIARAGNYLTVAISDTLNVFALDDLSLLTNLKIVPVITLESEIQDALDQHYHQGENFDEILADLEEDEDLAETVVQTREMDIDKMRQETSAAPVIKLVNLILTQAIDERASDIHIEPFERKLLLRYRIDGILYDRSSPPYSMSRAIVSRLKVMSQLDISEHRLPQDGRFRIRTRGREVDFRISTLPTVYGEKSVLRILDKTSQSMDVNKLGLNEYNLTLFNDALDAPHGMIFVTGPTGSGKTTTLYAALQRLNQPAVNIITIEDPVEYQFHGINQVQVNADIDLNFATGLRSILRQDPDIVMVGEVRDFETADIAVKAALTGHLVLTTLHTNDAAGSFARIIDMGVEPFLAASAIRLVAAQRLARRLCTRCKKPVTLDPLLLERAQYRPAPGMEPAFCSPVGCSYCRNTGYSGRVALFELINVDDDICKMIMRNTEANIIKQMAINKGMYTLRQIGLQRAAEGVTSLEEVLRVTAAD
jgi:type IV pilus assembly protein PilB